MPNQQRVIKFRAWHKELKKFVYWDSHSQPTLTNEKYAETYEIGFDNLENDQQFTGLLDSKGNEIWEGDILQGSDTSPKYEVCFERGCWVAAFKFQGNGGVIAIHDKQSLFEVLGNIYENPELLNA